MMARAFAGTVVSLRWLIVLGWIAVVAFAVLRLPALGSSGGLTDLIPAGSAAAHAETDATRLFGFPLDPGVAVVQRDPHGMPQPAVTQAVQKAAAVDRTGSPIAGLRFAVPLPNNPGLLKGTAEHSTSVLTYLVFRNDISFAAQTEGAARYGQGSVTGLVPARNAQNEIIIRDLGRVELFTVLAIALIVAIRFGSLGAPIVALTCAATAYEVSVRVVAWVAQRENISLPPDLEPILVVLLLGVTTDYSVFFLAGMRARIAEGVPRAQAARLATAEYAPITLAAGLLVAAGTASLVVARTQLLQAFGPGLGLTVLIAMAVSMTLCPALMAIFGKLLFARRYWEFGMSRLARLAATKPVALLLAAGCVAGLVLCALGARQLGLGSPLIKELPSSSSIVRASDDASAAFAPGILSPTEVLAIGPVNTPGLARFEDELRRQRGVAIVVGPTDLPSQLNQFNPMLAKSGGAARFAVVTTTDPLGSTAVSAVRQLTAVLPALGRQAGLTGVRFEVGGETALTSDAIGATTADLGRIALAIGVVTVLLLMFFLRALLAPLYLLAASVLAVLATLGITTLLCRALFGSTDLVYYVPFAAGVLLVSLGSDYNVFVVGRIWEEARRPGATVADAVAVAVPKASRAITTAGIALAASFALLAVIPLLQFRQLALMMAIGVILDAIVVRSLLVPALIALFGRVGMWPGGKKSLCIRCCGRRSWTPPTRGGLPSSTVNCSAGGTGRATNRRPTAQRTRPAPTGWYCAIRPAAHS
jgi:RND superfamily putative drug exporter